jgi:plastocyanin
MSTPIRSSIQVVLVSLVVLVGAGACSSSKASTATTTSTGKAGAAGASAVRTDSVTIKDYAFAPKSITVKVGTKVTWTNKDSFAHSIKDPATDQTGAQNIDPNASYSHTYTKAGTYPYVCAIHANMHGTVTVTAS